MAAKNITIALIFLGIVAFAALGFRSGSVGTIGQGGGGYSYGGGGDGGWGGGGGRWGGGDDHDDDD